MTWIAIDPRGRVVVLTLSAMEKVVGRGRRLSARQILAVVERAAAVEPDPHVGGRREQFGGRDERGRELRVVVEFIDGAGVVVTAFPVRRR